MSVKETLKDGVTKWLSVYGSAVVKRTKHNAFRALAERKHGFNTVIDVGASDGRWTKSLMKYFPQKQYLLIEAQPTHESALTKLVAENRNIQYVLAAAGGKPGQINFDASDPLGGQASSTPYASGNIQIPVTTIDNELQARNLAGPYLIKLDTHGFEVPIIEGASRALRETEVIIMECYNYRISPECLLFYEMCGYLGELGFRCIDLVSVMNRPCDDSLWQMDIVFVKKDRPEFAIDIQKRS